MREQPAVHATAGEGVARVVAAASKDLTVREAILAAAELNSGVPDPRPPADTGSHSGAGPGSGPDSGSRAGSGSGERRRHG
ncbi:hypothetical protein [Amycolatopsis sp.]|uniref:hypothetical protein n=1 Tax=Amycolatopsis sp. TaxID=37632 RepID=UPI002D7E8D5C|nr:hypothetical protein [Amycolatopsis sp.]HET6703412.1 hypothetical protein [Amycolatopsis sp.]